jgi:hypothetical protein
MKYQTILKTIGLSAVAWAASAHLGFSADEKPTRKPNIILIFADDLGWKDVGYQGSDFYETPNIDRLANEGMVFSSGYAAAGNCAPGRASLLSGNYTPRHGVYAVGSTSRGPKELARMIPIPNKSGLAKENITMADALKEAGYVTGIFGKWHLSGPAGAVPGEQGFDTVSDGVGKPHLYHEEWQLDGGRDALATNNAVELYNITQDIGERNNLANTETVKRDELVDELLAWWKSTGALVPTKANPDFDKDATPTKKAKGSGKKRSDSNRYSSTWKR